MIKAQVFYFDGCPSWKEGLKNFNKALKLENVKAEVDVVLIENDDDVAEKKFLGSPSFRINDADLWPEERESYSLGCRIYVTQDGYKGFPSVAMLREKIRESKTSA